MNRRIRKDAVVKIKQNDEIFHQLLENLTSNRKPHRRKRLKSSRSAHLILVPRGLFTQTKVSSRDRRTDADARLCKRVRNTRRETEWHAHGLLNSRENYAIRMRASRKWLVKLRHLFDASRSIFALADGYGHETPTIQKIALVNVLLVVRSAFRSFLV